MTPQTTMQCTLTINFDSAEVGTTTFGSGSAFAWTFDSTAGTDTSIAFGSNSQIFTSGTASFSGRLGNNHSYRFT
ncbi:hypothetical protein IPH70_00465 [Candidatus Roizmanbacteria bacterium]|nr:MAG: hypothetical protein IPH70_00465 [Candidatus Roizmanbacteria bacterium]